MGLLTDTTIRNARVKTGDRLVLSDGGGLELQVTAKGVKSWYLRVRVKSEDGGTGLQRRIPLGAYPAVSLSAARGEAVRIRSEARTGRDPMAAAARSSLGTGKPKTVAAAAKLYSDHLEAGGRAKSYVSERSRLLTLYLLPKLGKLSPQDVDRAMLSAVVEQEAKRQLKAKQKGVQARRLASVITAMWRFMEDKGWLVRRSDADRLLVSVAAEQPRDRVLSDQELGSVAFALGLLDGKTFYDRQDNGHRPSDRGTIDAMALALLLGLRGGEVTALMSEDVVDDPETGMTVLRIASRGGKTAAARRDIPLPPLALSIVRRRQKQAKYGQLFPTPSGKSTDRLTVSGLGYAASQLAEKLGHRDAEGRKWTTHDLRRTLASILGERDVVEAVQKRILGHAGADVTSRVYDRSRRQKQMLEALTTAETWILERARVAAKATDKVVALTGR